MKDLELSEITFQPSGPNCWKFFARGHEIEMALPSLNEYPLERREHVMKAAARDVFAVFQKGKLRDVHEMAQGELLEACNPHSPFQMLEMISTSRTVTIYQDTANKVCILTARPNAEAFPARITDSIRVKADNLISLICRAFILWKRNGLEDCQ